MIILDGKKVAKVIEDSVLERAKRLRTQPKLGIISCWNNAASEVYVLQKMKAAERCGIHAEHVKTIHVFEIMNFINGNPS